mgnify:CR=1 FL=1
MITGRAALRIGSLLALPWIAASGSAQTQPVPAPAAESPRPVARPAPVYKPPLLGAPATRVGGASRGGPDGDLALNVLTPETTGLTSRAQPTLYWHSSKGLARPLEFTLNDPHSIKPLVEMKVNATQPGIHALRLAYPLKPGVEYQWAIAAIADPDQRASDTIASGAIKRVEPSPALTAQLQRASQREQPFLYAEHGFWYDALAVLSEQLDAHPADQRLREQRAALLEQVGLNVVARSDQPLFAPSTEPAHVAD